MHHISFLTSQVTVREYYIKYFNNASKYSLSGTFFEKPPRNTKYYRSGTNAKGHFAVRPVEILLEQGVERSNIRFLALIVAPEGMTVFNKQFADIPIYAAALDERLNDKAYMIPGLGDAGDRLFGTK